MQVIFVTGYAGRDAQVNTLQDGTNAINFSLGESYRYVDKQTGEEIEKTTWYDVSYMRKSGQSTKVAKHIKKGTQILIQGRVTASTYTTKSGKVVPILKLYADRVELLSQPRTESVSTNTPAVMDESPTPQITDSQEIGPNGEKMPF